MSQYFAHLLTMSSITQEDGFTEITRGRKKRKASGSPTLPSQPKPGFSEPPLGTPVCPKPNLKNKIPMIPSGVDGKFKNWRSIMGELRQYHPSLKIKELPKNDFLVIGDSVLDVIILQSETKMKAALGPGGRGTPILGHIRDVRPEWVSFPGRKPADGCTLLTENLRMGHNFDIILPGNGWFSSKLNKTYYSLVNFYCK